MVVTLSALVPSSFNFPVSMNGGPTLQKKKSFSQSDDLAVQPQLQVGQNIQTVI